MIRHELSDLPPEKIRKIREWLDREELVWLTDCVKSEIAVKQAEATNIALSEPHKTIGDERAFPPESTIMIKEAAILEAFLRVLSKMREKDAKFQTVRLTL